MRFFTTAILLSATSILHAQQVTVNLTHDGVGTVSVGDTVNFTLSYSISGFPVGAVVSSVNQSITPNDPSPVQGLGDFLFASGFNGGFSGGLGNFGGGILDLQFDNSLFIEALGGDPAIHTNPLMTGAFAVQVTSQETLNYSVSIGGGVGSFLSLDLSPDSIQIFNQEDVIYNIQPLVIGSQCAENYIIVQPTPEAQCPNTGTAAFQSAAAKPNTAAAAWEIFDLNGSGVWEELAEGSIPGFGNIVIQSSVNPSDNFESRLFINSPMQSAILRSKFTLCGNAIEFSDPVTLTILKNCGCGAADLNLDGFIDSGDISIFIAAFIASDPIADLNFDGFTDSGDISLFVSLFLAGC